ncbi:LysR family transcriptional regulator [Pseudomonas putida]|uniref:LysR family transcriptional regulator n=1 Tax=Pseudomonas putida TaxID=303 RepID=UPI00277A6C37|nr:LysR family transcriptional regulator [Pseudomonas putida]MDP9524069.1 LysR family transcriptional regulator [Pseudomonas putida]
MDKFSNMSVFVKVVEMGSFTAVANHLDSTVGNVSRAVSALEQMLDTRLLQRYPALVGHRRGQAIL